MLARQNALQQWLQTIYGDTDFFLAPLAGDASFRRYFRLTRNHHTFVVMDAPPNREQIEPFVTLCRAFSAHGIRTPELFAVDLAQGFILLEDFGDTLLLSTLTSITQANLWYPVAIDQLLTIQQCPRTFCHIPTFNIAYMHQEMGLFLDWFIQRYLGLTLSDKETVLIQKTFETISTKIAQQPQVVIHRDYHSRNLIVLPHENNPALGIIDFQDAMMGPLTYDLVSLLKDCYIQWPKAQMLDWLSYAYQRLSSQYNDTFEQFYHAFELCGLQRHLKVLGIFSRLHLRDAKSTYLRDLPLTLQYIMASLEDQPTLADFYDFMQHRISPALLQKQAV